LRIDEDDSAIAFGDDDSVRCRLQKSLERLFLAARLRLGVDQLGRKRPYSGPEESRPSRHESEQQAEDELKLLADRSKYFGSVDLHDHSQTKVADRTERRDHVLDSGRRA
jgi:hypothetical protein